MSRRNKLACTTLAVLLVFLTRPVQAQEPSLLKTPYQLEVVLHFSKQSVFTVSFREQVKIELTGLLQQSFGKLAEITITSDHPLLKEIDKYSLQKVLDPHDKLSEKTYFFVLVDFNGGTYRLQSRQYDGRSGLPSPLVHMQSIADRKQVARLAALMIERNFGVSGTVVNVQGKVVEVAIQGGALGVPLEKWIEPGDVLAVSNITTGKLRSERLQQSLLQIKSALEPGVYRCSFHTSRYDPEEIDPGTDYRCLKLNTIKTELSFHLVAERTDQPLSGLQLHVSPVDFDDNSAKKDSVELSVNAKGRVRTDVPFKRVAFVRVVDGVTILAEFPVAIVNQKVITCRIEPSLEATKEGRIARRHIRWLKRIYEDLYLASSRVQILKAELDKSPEKALTLAKKGIATLETELKHLRQERMALEAAADKGHVKLDLGDGNERIGELRQRKEELANFIDDLKALIKEDAQTKQLKTMLAQARLLEEQAKFVEAIDVYQQIVDIRPKETEVKEHLQMLKTQWYLDRGKAHQEAREFVMQTWPKKMTTAELKAQLPKAVAAFAVLKKNNDRLTPRKMIAADLSHAIQLKKRLEVLDRSSSSEDNRNEAKLIAELGTQLRDLHNEVQAWVKET